MKIHQLEIGNFKNFVYLIASDGLAYVIDPQRDLFPWEKTLNEESLTLAGCLLTHSHWDHVAGIAEIARKYNVPIMCHPLEFLRLAREPEPVQRNLRPLDPEIPLLLGKLAIEVLHCPGHSSGEVSFLIKTENPWHLFTGDTVFVGDTGRTDLETGSAAQMFSTLQMIKTLPEDTIIWPGHNYGSHPTSTLGAELQNNKSFQAKNIQELEALP